MRRTGFFASLGAMIASTLLPRFAPLVEDDSAYVQRLVNEAAASGSRILDFAGFRAFNLTRPIFMPAGLAIHNARFDGKEIPDALLQGSRIVPFLMPGAR